MLSAAVALGVERSFHGVVVTQGPAVVFAPSFAPTMSELRRRFPTAAAVRLTARSTLLVDGNAAVRSNRADQGGGGVYVDSSELHIRDDARVRATAGAVVGDARGK